jgi:hypothetical protein
VKTLRALKKALAFLGIELNLMADLLTILSLHYLEQHPMQPYEYILYKETFTIYLEKYIFKYYKIN